MLWNRAVSCTKCSKGHMMCPCRQLNDIVHKRPLTLLKIYGANTVANTQGQAAHASRPREVA